MRKKNKNDIINTRDKRVVDLHNTLITRLADPMSELVNSAQEILHKMADETDNNGEERRYFGLMNEIRPLKSGTAESFTSNIIKRKIQTIFK